MSDALAGLLRLPGRLRDDLRAVTALEYGLIAALVAAVIITALTHLGSNTNSLFSTLSTTIGSHAASN